MELDTVVPVLVLNVHTIEMTNLKFPPIFSDGQKNIIMIHELVISHFFELIFCCLNPRMIDPLGTWKSIMSSFVKNPCVHLFFLHWWLSSKNLYKKRVTCLTILDLPCKIWLSTFLHLLCHLKKCCENQKFQNCNQRGYCNSPNHLDN